MLNTYFVLSITVRTEDLNVSKIRSLRNAAIRKLDLLTRHMCEYESSISAMVKNSGNISGRMMLEMAAI